MNITLAVRFVYIYLVSHPPQWIKALMLLERPRTPLNDDGQKAGTEPPRSISFQPGNKTTSFFSTVNAGVEGRKVAGKTGPEKL